MRSHRMPLVVTRWLSAGIDPACPKPPHGQNDPPEMPRRQRLASPPDHCPDANRPLLLWARLMTTEAARLQSP